MKQVVAFVTLLIAGFGSYSGFAEPSVQNVDQMAHMGEAVINGQGFGAKSPAAPYFWDFFDSGSEGDFISSPGSPGWIIDFTVPDKKPRYSRAQQRYGGSMSSLQEFSGDNYNSTLLLAGIPANNWYVSAWYYDDDLEAVSRNEKILSWRGGALGGANIYPQLRVGYDNGGGHTYSINCNEHETVHDWSFPKKNEDEWRRIESWWAPSNTGSGDVLMWDNLVNEVHLTNVVHGDCSVSHLYFHHYFTTNDGDGNPSSQNWYWDEVYVDNTLARVEVGDNQIWDECTKREIQIPIAWMDSEIRIIANRGSFSVDEDLYLFVIDNNGVPNSTGLLVQFGGEPPPPSPGQPGQPEVSGQN